MKIQLTLLLTLLCALPVLAQPTATDFEKAQGRIFLDGSEVLVEVFRATRSARVSTYLGRRRVIHQEMGISPGLFQEVERAFAEGKEDSRHGFSRGSRRPDSRKVAALQARLLAEGYEVPQTGTFDLATEDGLKELQRSRGLQATGAVDSSTGDLLGLRAPRGDFFIGDSRQLSERKLMSKRLHEVMLMIAQSVKHQAEPEQKILRGELVETDHSLELWSEPDPTGKRKRYDLSGAHPDLERAAGLLGSASLKAYVWPGQAGADLQPALFSGIKVKATPESGPVGVPVGEDVQVVGIEEVPVQSKPVQSKPVQSKPVQSKPVQPKPVQSKPVQKPQTKPSSSKPTPVKHLALRVRTRSGARGLLTKPGKTLAPKGPQSQQATSPKPVDKQKQGLAEILEQQKGLK